MYVAGTAFVYEKRSRKLAIYIFRDVQLAEHRWNGYTSYDNSAIVDIFVGLLKSTLTCSVCDHKSVTFDPFWDLSLPLPRSKTSGLNLQSCFAEFTQVFIISYSFHPQLFNKRLKSNVAFSLALMTKLNVGIECLIVKGL